MGCVRACVRARMRPRPAGRLTGVHGAVDTLTKGEHHAVFRRVRVRMRVCTLFVHIAFMCDVLGRVCVRVCYAFSCCLLESIFHLDRRAVRPALGRTSETFYCGCWCRLAAYLPISHRIARRRCVAGPSDRPGPNRAATHSRR